MSKQTEKPKTTLPSFADLFGESKSDDYFIPLFPDNIHWLQFMSDTEEGKAAAKKLYDALSDRDGVWGLSIPKKKGICTKERIAMTNKSATKSNAALSFNKLLLKIAEGSPKADITKLSNILATAIDSGISELNPDELAFITPHLEDIQAIEEEFNSIHETVPQVTYLLRTRAIPDWSETDTLLTHEGLFNQLLRVFRQEQSYKPTEDEKNPTPASTTSDNT